jgi:hypothetical protein
LFLSSECVRLGHNVNVQVFFGGKKNCGCCGCDANGNPLPPNDDPNVQTPPNNGGGSTTNPPPTDDDESHHHCHANDDGTNSTTDPDGNVTTTNPPPPPTDPVTPPASPELCSGHVHVSGEVTTDSCSDNASYYVKDSNGQWKACFGMFNNLSNGDNPHNCTTGNCLYNLLVNQHMCGQCTWVNACKVDGSGSSNCGDVLTGLKFSVVNNGLNGTWSLSGTTNYPLLISAKFSTEYVAYYMGVYSTAPSGTYHLKTHGLSHMTLWAYRCPQPPLP